MRVAATNEAEESAAKRHKSKKPRSEERGKSLRRRGGIAASGEKIMRRIYMALAQKYRDEEYAC